MSDTTTRLDDETLRNLVTQFYARVRADEALGPIFEDKVEDWPEHLDRLTNFWSAVMLTSGRYKGSPLAAHRALGGRISPALFARWLDLWHQTTTQLLPAPLAAALGEKAERMAQSLQAGLFSRPA